jgi:SAM-dependent methyltransferase
VAVRVFLKTNRHTLSRGDKAVAENIVNDVQKKYAAVAAGTLSSDHAGVRAVAQAFGYSADELNSIPPEANMGLSCGNPTAFASLKPGETVLDLGCGGGLDVFLAARRVGPAGKAIGVDMTPEMIDRARKNALAQRLSNVEFHLAQIDRLPVADNSVACIISNCVINLAPDKSAVFREMFRVLKPGGRVAVSDIALKKPLPQEVAANVMAYIGCIAGAIGIADYERELKNAGFQAVHIVDTGMDLSAYALVDNQAACCSPAMTSSAELPQMDSCCPLTNSPVHLALADLLAKYNINDFAASVQVYALKNAV